MVFLNIFRRVEINYNLQKTGNYRHIKHIHTLFKIPKSGIQHYFLSFLPQKSEKGAVLRGRLEYKCSCTNLEARWSYRLLGSMCFCTKFWKSNIMGERRICCLYLEDPVVSEIRNQAPGFIVGMWKVESLCLCGIYCCWQPGSCLAIVARSSVPLFAWNLNQCQKHQR